MLKELLGKEPQFNEGDPPGDARGANCGAGARTERILDAASGPSPDRLILLTRMEIGGETSEMVCKVFFVVIHRIVRTALR